MINWKLRYQQHRSSAKQRGIVFLLTFDEWLGIWEVSGHLHERGRGGYVMARLGDKGPYAVDNVKIITAKENIQEGVRGFGNSSRLGKRHSAETRVLMSLSAIGKKATKGMTGRRHSKETIEKLKRRMFSEETRRRMSEAAKRRCR